MPRRVLYFLAVFFGAVLSQISQNGADVFEACSFQDITGQRITKVVKSVTYVEDRVNALIEFWGKDEIDKIEVKSRVGA